MGVTRPFVALRTRDQWLRCAHSDTSLLGDVVTLAWRDPLPVAIGGAPLTGAGLTFDSQCRLFHSEPEEGRVERLLWAAYDPLHPRPGSDETVDLFAPVVEPPAVAGEFASAEPPAAPLLTPRGLAVDAADRLFVAESGSASVLVFDLPSRALLRRIALSATPLGLAAHGLDVYCAAQAPAGLWRLSLLAEPLAVALSAGVGSPSRVAIDDTGRVIVLDRAGLADARVVALDTAFPTFAPADFGATPEVNSGAAGKRGAPAPRTPGHKAAALPTFAPSDFVAGFIATDIAFDAEGVLVVAGAPGADFLRFRLDGGVPSQEPPLRAPGYDGRGIVRTPDGRIAFWSARGLRHALPARLRYERRGRVTTFRLDSGAYQTEWGRLFLEACIPAGTSVRVACIATDEPPEGATLAPGLPRNVTPAPGAEVVPHPALTPPLPPLTLALSPDAAAPQALHRRETGRELIWSRALGDDPFETYEAPVLGSFEPARPGLGRYLWVTLELLGDTRATPRVRALRAEHPGHDLLQRLPRVFSREEQAASFLQRYLAPLEGVLHDLEARAAERRALLDPRGAPEELLPWLASFLGLALDGRFSADVRRTLIAEAPTLFRFRGTLAGLRRFIEICLGVRPLIVEHWRLRGVGAARVGPGGEVSQAVLGAGFRVGGALGDATWHPLDGPPADAFRTHAHRFSVIVPRPLGADETAMLRDVLERHRPAHTLYELCTVEGGMRVGLGLLVEMTTVVGPSAAFRPLQLGGAVLGRDGLVGPPGPFSRVGGLLAKGAGEWQAPAAVDAHGFGLAT